MLKNLATVPLEEQLKFIDSFDHVLTDMDGVIWLGGKPLPGAAECITALKKRGKRVNYVSNNAVVTIEVLHGRLKQGCIPGEQEDIFNPMLGVLDHLKEISFDKELFVLGTAAYKNEIRKAGYKVSPDPPQTIEENLPSLLDNITDDENIGAVLYDYDINLTLLKLQKALTYLKREDCLFIIGAGDKQLPVGKQGPIIGNQYFYQVLREMSGREPLKIAKPSAIFNKFIVKKTKVSDPKKVLFIGDTIDEDMKMATTGGYQKLLVLTGTAKEKDVIDWKNSEDDKPEYYVESLDILNKIIQNFDKKFCI